MASPLDTELCSILGIRHPILQTAMGWIATPELVAASSNAGAMGFLATANLRPDEVDREIDRVKQLTDRPFGVNLLMEAPGAEQIVDAMIGQRVRAASYSRAPNPDFIKRFKQAGILCIPTCGAVRHAQKAVQLGADVIVIQGGEGGGHTGSVPTSILVSQVVDAVDRPVVAAGGFHDGRGLVAALAFGAVGIAMGTRFLLTRESPVPAATAERYFQAGVDDLIVTTRIDGMSHRVIVNELVRELEASSRAALLLRALRSALAYRRLSGASIPELLRAAFALRRSEKLSRAETLMAANSPILIQAAMVEGRPAEGVLPSGTVAGVISDRPSCAELVERIMREAEQTLESLQR
ncbi:MAG: nitronate monooxygenase [Deltaproteobacteria bacterium]|nr:nitronate monooxygenase [Deltaproteobacteria bacterium]